MTEPHEWDEYATGDKVLVVCSPWGEQAVVSVKRNCVFCQAEVAVSHGTLTGMPDNAHFACVNCFKERASSKDYAAMLGPAPKREEHPPFPWLQ